MNVLLHALDGRLRLRVPAIKKDTLAATSLERSVREVKGVKAVKANAVTASVLILYNPWRVAQGDLLDLFGVSVVEDISEGDPHRNGGAPRRMLTEVVLSVLVEAACYYAVRRIFALPLRSL